MKLAVVLFVALYVVCDSSNVDLFKTWMSTHNKQYSLEEYDRRFAIFQDNIARNERLATICPKATFGLNKFSDLSPEEFATYYKMPPVKASALAQSCLAKGITAPKMDTTQVPDSWDWRTKGVVSTVKDQGQCGSCWTFSTIGNIESAWAIKKNTLTNFSEQMLVDCSHGCSNVPPYGNVCNQGCNGGWQWNAFFDIISWHGVQTATEYPYTGETGVCKMDVSKVVAPIQNYTCLSGTNGGLPADETQMQAYIYQNGPIAVALDATLLQSYSSGILDPWFPDEECDPTQLDHALLIVGWGVETDWDGTTPYWIIKNSWADSWGEKGYFRILRGKNVCGLANAVSSVIM